MDKQQLQSLIAKGRLSEALDQLLELAEKLSNRYLLEEVLHLKSRYADYQRKERMGVISQEQSRLVQNQISQATLELINQKTKPAIFSPPDPGTRSISEEKAEPETKSDSEGSSIETREGSILYCIPNPMKLGTETKCVVRIALDEKKLAEGWKDKESTTIKKIQVSKVMHVELIDPLSEKHFKIREITSNEQFIDFKKYSEWIFYVKPLFEGEYPLMLKVSVVEVLNNKERKRDIVLEESIRISSQLSDEELKTCSDTKNYKVADNVKIPVKKVPKTNANIPWIVGVALLLIGIIYLAIVKCPTEPQFFGIRLLLALGAGGFATILKGSLKIDNQFIVASGAMGLAVLIYLFNPAKMAVAGCDTGPFDFTARLLTPDLPNYPALENGNLKIWVVNRYEKPELNSDLLAEVKGIPSAEEGKKVDAYLEGAVFWKLAKDSVLLSKNSQTLQAVPDGSLAVVSGRVKKEAGNGYLAGVLVEVAGMTQTTDEFGKFHFEIPMQQQTKEYQLQATKEGYSFVSQAVYPSDKPIEILMKK